MGIEEPFLHRSGAKSGDSKNNSKQALPPVGKNFVPKPDFCPAGSDNRNIFNGVENSRRSLGILRRGGVEKVRKWHMGCGEAGHGGICFDKAG